MMEVEVVVNSCFLIVENLMLLDVLELFIFNYLFIGKLRVVLLLLGEF